MRAIATFLYVRRRIVFTDLLILLIAYLVPALAHLVSIPLYLSDPMRILVLTGYFLARDKINGYFLALTVPLFSLIISGHPAFFKSLLISIELAVNIGLFTVILSRVKWPFVIVLMASILLSKFLYYILKYLLLSLSLIQGDLFSTGILIQLVMVSVVSILLGIFFGKSAGNQGT